MKTPFFERVGKYCFAKERSVLFFLVLSLPIVYGCFHLFSEYSKVQALEERFVNACKKGKTAIERKQKKEQFVQKFSNADPYFLDKKIESLPFLSREISELEKIIHHPALVDKRLFSSRLEFLKRGDNRLSFVEESIRSSGSIKETEEKQRYPVQMSEEDLKKLLSALESIPVGPFSPEEKSPQIVITDFRIEKRKTPVQTEVFEVDMQFLKREFN